MEFWCVQTKKFDGGRVKMKIYPVVSDVKPQDGRVENLLCEEERKHFDSYEEAENFVKDIENKWRDRHNRV